MKLLQVDGRRFFFRRVAKDPCRPFEELVFPLLDLVGMNIELLGKLGEGLFTADSSKGHLRFESRTVIPARSSGHGRLLCSANKPICRQKSHLTTPFRFPEPHLLSHASHMDLDRRSC
jgi:hypothetical protein